MTGAPYNFMFATNADFGWLLPLVLASIFDHAPAPCRVFIFYSSLHDKDRMLIMRTAQFYGQEVVLEKYDIKHVLDNYHLDEAPAWFGSFDAYTRIFAAEDLYQRGIEKCIYLDCDVLIIRSLDSLFEIYDGMQTIGGLAGRVPDSKNPFMTDNYLNSGVLVMNLKYLHEHDFTPRCVAFLQKHAAESGYMDQDAISNSLDQSAVVNIGAGYNMIRRTRNDVEQAVILHYAGQKPWRFWRKWSHAKYVYYELRLFYFLKLHGMPVSRGCFDRMFSIIEILTSPLVYLLNSAHDLNFKRRMHRKKKRLERQQKQG